jgi:hypothetical protein
VRIDFDFNTFMFSAAPVGRGGATAGRGAPAAARGGAKTPAKVFAKNT